MTAEELKEKIKVVVRQVCGKPKGAISDYGETASDELTKFPELKSILVDLLTVDFNVFIASIDWVAPRPTTFRIILANDQVFYLTYTDRSWIGKVEGKKYYLLNISEEQNCIESIARILSYGAKETPAKEEVAPSEPTPETPAPETPAPEAPAEETPAEEVPPQA